MKAWDVLHHATLVDYNITLKTIHIACWDFQPNHYRSACQSDQRLGSNKAREAYEQTSVLQHYQVELTIRLDQVL